MTTDTTYVITEHVLTLGDGWGTALAFALILVMALALAGAFDK